MANARVRRGRKTQDLIAARWRKSGLFPDAEPVPASLPGKDIRNTFGYSVEVKARAGFDPVAAMRQARANAEVHEIPVAIFRPNGMGPARIAEWKVVLDLQDFEYLVAQDQAAQPEVVSDET